MSSLPRVLAIVGPTASGKTPLSVLVAEQLNGEIVSADSRQIYRHLDIGTAKPTREELKRIRHHFIDILNPTEEYSAGQYGTEARRTVQQILRRGRTPILTGGSGLYLKAVIDGLFEGPGKDPDLRYRLEQQVKTEGAESLYETLKRIDPVSAEKTSPTKPRRIIRALEVYYATGTPISRFHIEQKREPSFAFVQVGLDWERKELYQRINDRVEGMMLRGFVEEVERLREMGFERTSNALNTVGYKEMFDYLEGNVSLEEAVELMKRNTRRFAKRQLTWFRADKRIAWLKVNGQTSFEKLADRVAKMLND